jgi:hypothetical protein
MARIPKGRSYALGDDPVPHYTEGLRSLMRRDNGSEMEELVVQTKYPLGVGMLANTQRRKEAMHQRAPSSIV